MKKIVHVCMVIILCIFLSGCSEKLSQQRKLTPIVLHEQDQVMNVVYEELGNDSIIFEYEFNMPLSYIVCDVYKLEDGNWRQYLSSSIYEKNKKGIVAISPHDLRKNLNVATGKEKNLAGVYRLSSDDDKMTTYQVMKTMIIEEEVAISNNRKIPIIAQYFTNDSDAMLLSPKEIYEHPQELSTFCGEIYVVTVTFMKDK